MYQFVDQVIFVLSQKTLTCLISIEISELLLIHLIVHLFKTIFCEARVEAICLTTPTWEKDSSFSSFDRLFSFFLLHSF
jgi:hypothetical protein